MVIIITCNKPNPKVQDIAINVNGSEITVGSIGKNTFIEAMDIRCNPTNNVIMNVHIGNYSSIARNCAICINRNHDYKCVTSVNKEWVNNIFSTCLDYSIKKEGQVIIGNDVWIGDDVKIVADAIIGDGAVIGANSVVTKNIPLYAIAVGNPIKVIKYRFSQEQIIELLKIRWWDWKEGCIKKNNKYFNGDINYFINKFKKKEKYSDQFFSSRKTKILMFPDFEEENYPIWQKIISEYNEKFTEKDEITLILRIKKDKDFQKNIHKVDSFLKARKNFPDILILNDNIDNIKNLFANIDFYITTRSKDIIYYTSICNELNKTIISGVDIPALDEISIL